MCIRDRPTVSPIRRDHTAQSIDFDILPRVANIPPWIRRPKEASWKERDSVDLKYIDDGINIATVNMCTVSLCFEGDPPKPTKIVHPIQSQAMLNHIVERAAGKGMVVNDAKTSLTLCYCSNVLQGEGRAKRKER